MVPASDQAQDDARYPLRHSLAHLLAQAVLEIRPRAKLGFGPPVDNGFYYDFDFGPEPITEADLPDLEQRMQKLIKQRLPFVRTVKTVDEAVTLLGAAGQTYKIEHARELAAKGAELSFYSSGSFTDLCEGPHLEDSGLVPKASYCLDRIAGSYWRGDEKNPMLTRIYGLAFANSDELQQYQERRELARQRDHRRLGTELELFSISDEVGGGLILWHPHGSRIRNAIETFWRERHYANGYELLYTPHLGLSELWKISGHLDFYQENMYAPIEIDERKFFVKPMNCPFHLKIYQTRNHSYRELPLRWAELGTVYRYEKSGVLNGLLRVRGFTQDDAQILCRPDQIEDEITAGLRVCIELLRTFGFEKYHVYLATKPAKAVGEPARWAQALASLRKAAERCDLPVELDEGGGAFYGPKIDLKIRDALDREWQCSTIQFDFNLPERFQVYYIGEDGAKHQPYMVHRALFGSLERFFALLVEHYGGAFPTWLAPVQVRLVPVGEHVYAYAEEIAQALKHDGFRVDTDTSTDSFNKKIRNAVTTKAPHIWIIGGKEAEQRTITWRRYVSKDQAMVALDRALAALASLRQNRVLDNRADVVLPLA